MKVTVVCRRDWSISTPTIQISDSCPVCGGPRGKPYHFRFHELGDWWSVNRWDNPCGHVDKYRDVLKEVAQPPSTDYLFTQ